MEDRRGEPEKTEHPDGRYEPTNEEILARLEPLDEWKQRRNQAVQRAVNLVSLGLGLAVFLVLLLLATARQGGDSSEGREILDGEIFMRTDNDYRGGVILKLQEEAVMVVKTNVTGRVVQLKRVPDFLQGRVALQRDKVYGVSGSQESLTAGPLTFSRYPVRPWAPENTELPRPGLYVTEYGEYDDSTGLIAVFYEGSLIVGVKMTGNKYVPAGKRTFLINTTDNMAVKMQHANIGFKNVRWVEEGYRLDSRKQMTGTFFKIQNTNQQMWDCEFYHISQLQPQMLH